MTTSTDARPTSQSPRMPLDPSQEQELKQASVKARGSFDVARKQPAVDIAPRSSLDSTASRLGFQASTAPQKMSLGHHQQQQQQNPQVTIRDLEEGTEMTGGAGDGVVVVPHCIAAATARTAATDADDEI